MVHTLMLFKMSLHIFESSESPLHHRLNVFMFFQEPALNMRSNITPFSKAADRPAPLKGWAE